MKIPKAFWEYQADDTVDWKVSLIGNNPVASKINNREKEVSPVPFKIFSAYKKAISLNLFMKKIAWKAPATA